MGMYTRFTFWAEVDDEAAEVVRSVLGGRASDEYDWMWRPVGSSSYSFHTQGTDIYRDPQDFWRLNIDGSCKNYEQEIQRFLKWVHPHVMHNRGFNDAFSGFWQYEGDTNPTLIWYTPGGWVFSYPEVPQEVEE